MEAEGRERIVCVEGAYVMNLASRKLEKGEKKKKENCSFSKSMLECVSVKNGIRSKIH